MRPRFAGDVNSTSLRLSDYLNALLSGYVTDVVSAARFPDKLKITLYGTPLTLGADTTMTVLTCVISVVDISATQ